MPDIAVDYSACLGDGDCVEACPLGVLELAGGGRWCRISSSAVVNREAEDAFCTLVGAAKEPVAVRIHFRVPACILCYACVAACRKQAIEVWEEYAVRQAVEPVKPVVPLQRGV